MQSKQVAINVIGFNSANNSDNEDAPQNAGQLVVVEKNRLLTSLHSNIPRICATLGFFAYLTYGISMILTGVYYRTIAAGVGLSTMALGMYFKPVEQTKEEIEHLKALPMPQYVATKFAHAFKPCNHVRNTIALGYFASSIPILIAGIVSERWSEVGATIDLTLVSSFLGLPVEDGAGFVLSQVYSLPTYNALTIYGCVLIVKEEDWLSLASSILGLGSTMIPLGIRVAHNWQDICEANGFMQKARALYK